MTAGNGHHFSSLGIKVVMHFTNQEQTIIGGGTPEKSVEWIRHQ